MTIWPHCHLCYDRNRTTPRVRQTHSLQLFIWFFIDITNKIPTRPAFMYNVHDPGLTAKQACGLEDKIPTRLYTTSLYSGLELWSTHGLQDAENTVGFRQNTMVGMDNKDNEKANIKHMFRAQSTVKCDIEWWLNTCCNLETINRMVWWLLGWRKLFQQVSGTLET